MLKKISLALVSLALILSLPRPCLAETVIEKVVRTGVLSAGSLTDMVPFVYVNEKGELVGYSVEIIQLIKDELQQQLGREITLEIVSVDPQNRIPKVFAREVDIVCDVSFTWERDKFVDFSVIYGIGGTKLLVKKGSSLDSPESLIGKKIGVVASTTAENVIKLIQPKATLVPVKNLEEGFAALQQGKIDAFASDGTLLEGYRQTVKQPNDFQVIPSQPYTKEGISCIVPEGNSKFLDLVNYTLVKFMQGYLENDPKSVEIVNRWFGKDGVITVDPSVIRSSFIDIINSREQIKIGQ